MLPSLVDLCLNSVADNLSQHILLFTISDDFYIKRKLEFLQKKYSPDLISRLCAEEDVLSEEFIDILINKYTRFLETRWFEKCPLAKLSSKLAEIGHNLEKIVCHHGCVEDEFPEAIKDSICHFNNLKSFTFRVKGDNRILKNVAQFCPRIEEIDVTHSPITSEGVRYLCRDENGKHLCTMLKKLCFGQSKSITSNDVEYLLKNLPSLEIIDLLHLPQVLYSVHKENLPSLDKVAPYNITTLILPRYFNNEYIIKVCVSVCPRLKNVSCVLRSKKMLSCLFNLPDLERLHISSVSCSEINIDSFLMSKGSRLTFLSIHRCTVSVSVLAEKCPCLKELILFNAHVLGNENSKPVFNSLSSLTFIFYNFLYSMYVKEMKLMLSSSLIKLESISFEMCDLESRELKGVLLKCCELYPIRNMAFCSSQIEKEFIEDLLRVCRTLDYLTLDDCVKYKYRKDMLCFSQRLPNKPKISTGNWIPPVWLSLLSSEFRYR